MLQAGAGSTSWTRDNVTVFMELAWPPGRRLDWGESYGPGDSYRYVRDTEGSLMASPTSAPALPAAARPTGINKDGDVLYAIPSKPSAI